MYHALSLPPQTPLTGARNGREGAITNADRLPGDLGTRLAEDVGAAYTKVLNVGAAVAAATFVALAILAVIALRAVPASGGADATHDAEPTARQDPEPASAP